MDLKWLLLTWFAAWIGLLTCSAGFTDPYKVLGISVYSTEEEIRKAYKKLAKHWHPDKNKNQHAQRIFITINEAFKVVSEEHLQRKRRKSEFDNYGFSSREIYSSRIFQHNEYNAHVPVLNQNAYKEIVLQQSYQKPYLIYIYKDGCLECFKATRVWKRLFRNLLSSGVCLYELNEHTIANPVRELEVTRLPQFVAVVSGRVMKYRSHTYSVSQLEEFLYSAIPHQIVTLSSKDSFVSFLRESFKANKPQAVLLTNDNTIPLMYIILAFEHRNISNFAYLNKALPYAAVLQNQYLISEDEAAVVILKEEPSSPEAVIKGLDMLYGSLSKALSQNRHLYLPRLASPKTFDVFCPVTNSQDKRLCVVLFTRSAQDDSYHRYVLRNMAKDPIWQKRKVSFLYINGDVQNEFFFEEQLHAERCEDGAFPLKLMVLWRKEINVITYDWLVGGWCSNKAATSTWKLENMLRTIINGSNRLKEFSNSFMLLDEFEPGFLKQLLEDISSGTAYVVDSYQFFSWSSPISIVANSMFLVAIFMVTVVLPLYRQSKENLRREEMPESSEVSLLGNLKLTALNNDRLIKRLPPGRITFVLLMDSKNDRNLKESPLMQAFSSVVRCCPRKEFINCTWLFIQEQLMWCTEMMEINKFGEIFPGTVLAINGAKKKVFIFKPRNADSKDGFGDFIGLDSEEISDNSEDELLVSMKRRTTAVFIKKYLPVWTERLLNGTLMEEVSLDYWPELQP